MRLPCPPCLAERCNRGVSAKGDVQRDDTLWASVMNVWEPLEQASDASSGTEQYRTESESVASAYKSDTKGMRHDMTERWA